MRHRDQSSLVQNLDLFYVKRVLRKSLEDKTELWSKYKLMLLTIKISNLFHDIINIWGIDACILIVLCRISLVVRSEPNFLSSGHQWSIHQLQLINLRIYTWIFHYYRDWLWLMSSKVHIKYYKQLTKILISKSLKLSFYVNVLCQYENFIYPKYLFFVNHDLRNNMSI